MPSFDPRFTPDYSPSQLKDLAVTSKQDPHNWLQWYTAYTNGQRSDDDVKQINKWRSFKGGHGALLANKPTPRRALALRNWGVDALKLIDNDKKLSLSDAIHSYETDKNRKQANVLAHITGASGSGKSTLLNELQVAHPNIITKDLDEFDEVATKKLKLPPKWKTDYTDEMLANLANKRQLLMDKWLAKQKKPVVLGGHHIEGSNVLDIPTSNKYLLDTPAWLSAWRAYRRSQNETPEHRRKLTELPQDWLEARRDIKQLTNLGYTSTSGKDIAKYIATQLTKQADYAKGIPDKQDYGDLSQLPVGQLLDYITQKHQADRAGLHTDLRFGTPDTGLYSWAVRKGMPSPGKKHLAVLQPVHSHEYKGFEGEIPSGYGKGTVKKDDEGKVLITKVEPGKVHLTVAHKRYPERYVLVKPEKQLGSDKNWLLMNTTPTKPIPYEKAHYKSIPAEKVESVIQNLEPNSSVQAKIDGAASLTQLLKDKIELLSYRQSKVHGGPILHTERAFSTIPNVNIPKEYQGSILRGELYGQQHGNKPVAPQILGGLLNSSIAKSLPAQQANDIKLKNLVFDIEQLGKKPITRDVPYADRMNMTKQVLAAITGKDEQLVKDRYHLPEEAKTPQEAMQLYKDIKGGTHPATEEGIVIHPPTGIPMKSKLTDEYKVYVRGMIPGKNKWVDRGAGAFVYSHEPDGPIVGEVGSGMTDQLRMDMFNNPNDFVGRQARIRSTRKLPSGALFQPSLLGLYEG